MQRFEATAQYIVKSSIPMEIKSIPMDVKGFMMEVKWVNHFWSKYKASSKKSKTMDGHVLFIYT